MLRQHQVGGIARKPAQKEHDRRDEDKQHEALQQPTDNVAAHPGAAADRLTGPPHRHSRFALVSLPRLLVGTRDTLEYVTEFVPAGNGRELADPLVLIA